MSKYFQVGDSYYGFREEAIKRNTYYEVGGQRFESRERAVEQIAKWRGDAALVSEIVEVLYSAVTRKTAKGNVVTEFVRGSIERVPRIVSVQKLDPTYIIVLDGRIPRMDGTPCYELNAHTQYSTRAEAEQERTRRQSEADKLAALTEADVKFHTITEADVEEVDAVLTLADLLERDADKIAALQTEVTKACENYKQLEKQAEASIAAEVANLKIKSTGNRYRITALKAKAAQEFGLQEAEQKLDAAVKAYHEAIHFDEFADRVEETLQENHSSDCWPDSDCRQCSYEPDADEIEEYLVENAEEFTLAEEETERAATT